MDASGSSNGYHSGLFASYQSEGGFRGIVSAAYSFFDGELNRNPLGTGMNTSHPRENVASIGADFEYDLPIEMPGKLTPTVSFRQVWARQNGIREGGVGNGGSGGDGAESGSGGGHSSGGLLASQVGGMTASQQRLTLGVNYARTFEVSPETHLTPSINVGWLHTFGDRQMTGNAVFLNDPSQRYSVRSLTMGRDALHVKTGVEAQWGPSWRAGLNYETELRGNGSNLSEEDKYFIEPHEFRRLRKFQAVIQHCEKGFHRANLKPMGADGKVPEWYRG